MRSEGEAKFAQEFIKKIATPLYEDKEWPKDKVYYRLLGYGNLGKLTVFYYNVPKSLLPFFWKYGTYNEKPWIPLFPEIQEQKKMDNAGIKLDEYRLDAIHSWIANHSNKRAPKIEFGFRSKEGPVSELTLKIPSREYIQGNLLSRFSVKLSKYENNRIHARAYDADELQSGLPIMPFKSTLTDEEYENYKTAIDNYNGKLQHYIDDTTEYIYRNATKKKVVFSIFNIGNIQASNLIVKLIYNTGQLVLDGFQDIKIPSFEEEKPLLSDFDKTRKPQPRIVKQKLDLILPIFGKTKTDPIKANTDYEYKLFNLRRLGHNDNDTVEVEFIQMNLDIFEYQIPYEINYDEEPETIEGTLTIKFEETEEISDELSKELEKTIEKLSKNISRSPWGI